MQFLCPLILSLTSNDGSQPAEAIEGVWVVRSQHSLSPPVAADT